MDQLQRVRWYKLGIVIVNTLKLMLLRLKGMALYNNQMKEMLVQVL